MTVSCPVSYTPVGAAFDCSNYILLFKKEKTTHRMVFAYLVGVSGFEPEASWTRTKRDTKLRHTPKSNIL